MTNQSSNQSNRSNQSNKSTGQGRGSNLTDADRRKGGENSHKNR